MALRNLRSWVHSTVVSDIFENKEYFMQTESRSFLWHSSKPEAVLQEVRAEFDAV